MTGATGYVASWIVHDFLMQGNDVRITVRDQSKVDKYQHLLDIEKVSEGTLTVYEADLLKEGSFDDAIAGAEIVLHTASPFTTGDKGDTQKLLIDPAVNGTKNVLNSVNKASSVTRVVLTSSVAAMYGDNIDLKNKGLSKLDESAWNTTSTLKNGAYSLSKTMAEKAAWAMAENQKRWDLVTIHPGFVMGPSLTKRKDSTSINTLIRLTSGEFKSGAPDLQFVFSDVRDIAAGHLKAAVTKEAKGRYIIANESGNLVDVGKIINKAFNNKYQAPKSGIPKWLIYLIAPMVGFTRTYVKNNVGYPVVIDHSKSIKELKMDYHSLEDTIIDHVKQLEKDGLI